MDRASVSRTNFPQLGEFYRYSDAPVDYTQQQLQQEFETYLVDMMDQMQTKFLSPVDDTLADLGFTSW